ncbi:MAG: sulfurtransferase [Desulfatiglandales bacterium]
MRNDKWIRYPAIAVLLLVGVFWSVAAAVGVSSNPDYPNARFLATAEWLQSHEEDPALVVVDVREDKYFDDKLIPGAVRMPWGRFRYDDTAVNMGGLFVGIERAQQILGAHGIARSDTVVLYDAVARDGGATSSYVFWVLDLLGHRDVKVLERGIEGWIEAGGRIVSAARKAESVLYQAPADEIDLRRWVKADFLMPRLGDPYYQILDVRSRQEYLGEKPDLGLDGTILKPGHIPTAYNIDYVLNWTDTNTKRMVSYPDLQKLYRGLDPNRAVVTYCHSARRSSFSYFVLRLMGFADVLLYESSWMEWGSHRYYYPVETAENMLQGLPPAETTTPSAYRRTKPEPVVKSGGGDKRGYISCGG